MKKFKSILATAFAGLIMLCVTAVKAQNMNRYITLIVQQGEWINLRFVADVANTTVKIVSGTTDTTFYVNDIKMTNLDYYAQSDTMRVYGDVKKFYCASNYSKITGLNASNNKDLTGIYCGLTHLSSLDVSGLTALTDLLCFGNKLSSLDVSGLTALKRLNCSNNKLSSLDVSGLSSLNSLNCYNNHLSSLNLSGLTALIELFCSNNYLSSLNFSGLTSLEVLDCSNNNFSSLDVSKLKTLRSLNCSFNNLSSLNVSGLTALKSLNCSVNKLSSLDVSELTALRTLSCFNNHLSFLDVSELTALRTLACFNNKLSSLNLSGITALRTLYCYGNQLSACGLDSIFHQLPMGTENRESHIFIKNETETNPGTFSCRDTIATNKFWDVLDNNGHNYGNIPIKNTTYACPEFTLGIKETKPDNIRLYPNPVKATLYMESNAEVSRIEVYDVLGCRHLSTTCSNEIDCSTLSAGIYFLKLTIPQGNLIKKFVKE